MESLWLKKANHCSELFSLHLINVPTPFFLVLPPFQTITSFTISSYFVIFILKELSSKIYVAESVISWLATLKGIAPRFSADFVIVLQNVELKNVELQNVEFQNIELQNAELQNVESYRMSNLLKRRNTKH